MLSTLSLVKYLLITILCITCNLAQAITIGTYNLPPFSMYEDGENIGMVTEILQELLKYANIHDDKYIEYPLARGLAEFKAERIDMFYPYVKTKEATDDGYILIGPIAKYSVALFVRKDDPDPIKLTNMQNLIVGVQRGSIEDYLIQKHPTLHIDKATAGISCLRMVLAERISACALGTLPGQYVAAINDLATKLEFTPTGDYANMYVALSKSLPTETIASMQQAYKHLMAENYFEKQQKAYEQRFSLFLKTLS